MSALVLHITRLTNGNVSSLYIPVITVDVTEAPSPQDTQHDVPLLVGATIGAFLVGGISAAISLVLCRRTSRDTGRTTDAANDTFEMTKRTNNKQAGRFVLPVASTTIPGLENTEYEFVEPVDAEANVFPTESQFSMFDPQPDCEAVSVSPSDPQLQEGIYEQVSVVQNCVLPSNATQPHASAHSRLPAPPTRDEAEPSQVGESTVYAVVEDADRQFGEDDPSNHTYGDISNVTTSEQPAISLTDNPAYGEFHSIGLPRSKFHGRF